VPLLYRLDLLGELVEALLGALQYALLLAVEVAVLRFRLVDEFLHRL